MYYFFILLRKKLYFSSTKSTFFPIHKIKLTEWAEMLNIWKYKVKILDPASMEIKKG